MECQPCDSKKLFKVFDASKRKRTRKKREGLDDTNSLASDDSNSANLGHVMSHKASVHDQPTPETVDGHQNGDTARGSNTTIRRGDNRSPRRHRRSTRDSLSLALKSGMASTPRSISPPQDGDGRAESPIQEQDSLIYAFLEEAIKRDKKKHRHRRHDEHRSHDRDASEHREHREHRHRHRKRRDDVPSRDRDKHRKSSLSPSPAIDQTVLLETFAKLCAQINEKTPEVKCTHSHKSLQCESSSRRHVCQHRPEPGYHDLEPTRIRSQENCQHYRSRDTRDRHHKHERHNDPPESPYYEEQPKYPSKLDFDRDPKYPSKMDFDREPKYSSRMDFNRDPKYPSKMDFKDQKYHSKIDVTRSRHHEEFHNYPPEVVATRTFLDHYRDRPRERDCRDYDRRTYEEDRRRYCEQKTSRSFDEHRAFEEERCRRTTRSDKDKYYDKPIDAQERHIINKERKYRRAGDRYDRTSIASRDDEFKERDRYSERERDSGLSVADGENSTTSARSNYLRVVKQEIAEQREAMDKMMNLWKDLMRCFKGITQSQSKDKALNESACENVRESAAAQLQLWRECMRRYETVARDVGDTDARLMEEISKQRSEMTEMANMWQECLQRYRDMSNDFNTLKQKLVSSESPTRAPAPMCAEGEGLAPPAPYRLPYNYPMPTSVNPSVYTMGEGTPLRGRASAPPAWWWAGAGAGVGARGASPRRRSSRRSSPDSRDRDMERDRDRRHRHKDARDEPRYKDKSGKTGAPRSEHRRRKR